MAKSLLERIEKIEVVLIFVILAGVVAFATLVLGIKLLDHLAGTSLENETLNTFVEAFLKVSLYWLGLIGGSMAIADRKNIAIDLLQQFASLEQRRKIDTYINWLSAIISIMLFVVCYWFWTSLFKIVVTDGSEVTFLQYFNVFARAIFPVYFLIFIAKFILAANTELQEEKFE